MSKLTRPQIFIIGGVTALVFGLGGYFGLIDPALKQLDTERTRRDTRRTKAEERSTAERKKKDANKQVAQAKADWNVYERRYMPDIDVSNTYSAWQDLINEQVRVLGPKMQKFLDSDKSVTKLQGSFALPAAPSDPNASLNELYVFTPGGVQVQGTFKNILSHVERWNRFDRLVLVTGLTLSGNSPNLVGQYNLQVFEYTHGDRTKAIAIPQASGGAGGAGGFGGGMMGGAGSMMGGPGMRGGGGPQMGGMAGAGAPAGGGGNGVKGGD